MKKVKLNFAVCILLAANCLLLMPTASFSQNAGVGINSTGNPANSKAMLDIDATGMNPKAGVLVPRMNTADRNAITSPIPESLLIYNTDTHCFEAYYNGGWVAFSCLGCQVPAQPGAITGTSPVCQSQSGAAYSVTNVAGVTYAWTYSGTGFTIGTGSGSNSITANFSASATSGTLSVTGSNTCGSGTASTFNITVNSLPTASISGNTTICNGSSTTLTASGTGTSWSWNTGSTTQAITVSPTSNTTYTVTVTSSGCTATTSATVTVNPLPNAPSAGTNTPSQTQIVWNWSTVSGATGYKWGTTSSYTSATNNGISTSYTQNSLTCNTAYTLYVWAYNACGNSSYTTLTQTTSCCVASNSGCGGILSYTDSRSGGQGTFAAVEIGTQCWMAVNLNYGTYTTNISAHTPQQSGYKFCQNLSGGEDATCVMGGLYEWANMMNGSVSCNGTGSGQPACSCVVQGLCPNGWHVPSHYEWTLLEKNVGSDPSAFPYDTITTGSLGANEGSNLKEVGTSHWATGNTGTNASGFTALPGGYSFAGSFTAVSDDGWWWSTTEYGGATSAWCRGLGYNNVMAWRGFYGRTVGLSVRCVKN